jgi:predicted nuclease of predicted toxin-antitoxin system
MRFLIDEKLSGPRLASRLRAQRHDPVLAGTVGLLSVTDARVMIYSTTEGLPVLTQNSEDFINWSSLPQAIIPGF